MGKKNYEAGNQNSYHAEQKKFFGILHPKTNFVINWVVCRLSRVQYVQTKIAIKSSKFSEGFAGLPLLLLKYQKIWWTYFWLLWTQYQCKLLNAVYGHKKKKKKYLKQKASTRCWEKWQILGNMSHYFNQKHSTLLSFNRSGVLFVTNFDNYFLEMGCPRRSEM